MSTLRTGRKLSAETCAKIAAAHTGEKFSEYRCLKIAEAKRGNTPYKNLLMEITKRQLSYKKLTEILGWKFGAVSRKMRDIIKFTPEEIAQLVEFFGVPAEYLMARDDGLSAVASEAERCSKLSVANRHDSPFKNLLAELDKRQLSYSALAELMG